MFPFDMDIFSNKNLNKYENLKYTMIDCFTWLQ